MAALIDWLLGREPDDLQTRALAEMQIATSSGYAQVPITELFGDSYDRRLPAAYRARLMTINTVGQLDIQASSTAGIVRRPDPSMTRQQWVRDSVTSLVDTGNLYWRLIPGGGAPASAVVADPADVVVTWDQDRVRRLYQWRNQPMRHGRDIIHVAMGRKAGELYGRGPMQHRRLAGVAAALNYSEQYFINNGEPTGTLEVPYDLDENEADRLVDRWVERHPPGSRRPAVTSGGLKWNPGSLSPKDSDWVNTHGAGILDVAQTFGIAARLLGYSQPGSSLTYGNVQDVYLSWWRETLQPDYVSPIEEAWSDMAGASIMFDPTKLIRGDIKTRYESYALGIERGFLVPNEARASEGLPPLVEQPARQEEQERTQ